MDDLYSDPRMYTTPDGYPVLRDDALTIDPALAEKFAAAHLPPEIANFDAVKKAMGPVLNDGQEPWQRDLGPQWSPDGVGPAAAGAPPPIAPTAKPKDMGGIDEETRRALQGVLSSSDTQAPQPAAPPPQSPQEQQRALPAGPGMATSTVTASSVTPGFKASKSVLDAEEKAFAAKENAIQASAVVGQAKAAEEAAYQRQQVDELRYIDATNQIYEAKRQEYFDQEREKYNAAIENVSKLHVDPERFWNKKDVGQKIGLALSIGVGAFASAMLKTENTPMMIINRAIDADIDAQKAEIANAKDLAGLQRNRLADLRQQGLDARQAEFAARDMSLDVTSRQLAALAASYKSPEIRANAEALMAEIQKERASINGDHEKDAFTKATYTTQTSTAPVQSGVSPELQYRMQQDQEEKFVPVGGPNSGGFLARTKEEAKQLRDGNAELSAIRSNVARAKEILSTVGTEAFGKNSAELEQLWANNVARMNQAARLGTLDSGSLPLLEAQVPRGTNWIKSGDSALKRFEAFEKMLNDQQIAKFKTYGYSIGGK